MQQTFASRAHSFKYPLYRNIFNVAKSPHSPYLRMHENPLDKRHGEFAPSAPRFPVAAKHDRDCGLVPAYFNADHADHVAQAPVYANGLERRRRIFVALDKPRGVVNAVVDLETHVLCDVSIACHGEKSRPFPGLNVAQDKAADLRELAHLLPQKGIQPSLAPLRRLQGSQAQTIFIRTCAPPLATGIT